ncbi:MAG TPA: DUF362 domain-containing protein [Anaerolineales bacterium]|nr:DUF362 domain-containing protein [Anaerolineales bacterium]
MKAVIAKVRFVANKIRQNTLFIGIASLIWLLYRSGTKPSRVRYPCQQASMVNVSMYLSPAILPLTHRLIRVRETLTVRAVLRAVGMVTLFYSCFLLIEAIAERVPTLYAPPAGEAMRQHGAIGIRLNAKNLLDRPVYATSPQALQLPVPNRVVSVHDSRATNWDYQTGYHWQYIDQEVVNDMVARGVMALTERSNTVDAWNDLIPYQPGEEVVIKLNFNNAGCSGYNNQMDGYPEPVNAVIDGLTSIGVPPGNIWITDPSRVVPARFRDRITNPDVQYYAAGDCGDPNSHAVDYVDSNSPDASVAQCPAGEKIRPSQVFVDAEHLINIPLLKSHTNYPTLVLKNHYGSVIYRDNTLESMHAYFEQWGNSGGCNPETKNILADINNNPHIRDKTRLVIGDGLFGNQYLNWGSVEKWRIFGNDDPNILFFGADPVAAESVMADYIVAERGRQDHGYLHAAANLGLGVHDHWNSFENKHYNAIDYQIIDLDALELILHGEPATEAIHLTWEVEGTLPVTSTWQIVYDGLAGNQPSPITGIISPTRAYTLTGLTGFTWYSVTLNAVLDSTPFLTDTVHVMPTGWPVVYLPLVLKDTPELPAAGPQAHPRPRKDDIQAVQRVECVNALNDLMENLGTYLYRVVVKINRFYTLLLSGRGLRIESRIQK